MGNHKKKKKEGFRTLREAKAYERYFLEKAAARPNMSFSTLVAIYMEDYKTRLKPTTISRISVCSRLPNHFYSMK
jgi:hypothetical protein